MPKKKMSAPWVEGNNEPGEYYDEVERGLILRVREANEIASKTWYVRYRKGKTYHRYMLGKFPRLQLSDARKKARSILAKVDDGKDPADDKAKRAREERTRPGSLTALIDIYVETHAEEHHKNWKAERSVFNNHVKPALGKRKLDGLTRADFFTLIEDIAKTQPGTAREALKHLKVMYRWAENREKVAASPVAGIYMKDLGKRYQYKPGERHLTDNEVKTLWPAWEDLGYPFGQWQMMLLITGQRRTECAQMRWRDIDFDTGIWTIPAADEGMDNKSGRTHEVPLSRMALDILESIAPLGDHVFTTDGATHIQGFSKAKIWVNKSAPIKPWRYHDLRRTVATGLGDLGFRPYVINAMQNRKLPLLDTIYIKSRFRDEMRHAHDAWGNHLFSLIHPNAETTNVVTLGSVS